LPPQGLVRCRVMRGSRSERHSLGLWLIAVSRVPDRVDGPAPRSPEGRDVGWGQSVVAAAQRKLLSSRATATVMTPWGLPRAFMC